MHTDAQAKNTARACSVRRGMTGLPTFRLYRRLDATATISGCTVSCEAANCVPCKLLGSFKAGATRRVIVLSSLHPGQGMYLDRKQPPLVGTAPPYVCGVGVSINRQRNAVKRLRRTSNSHLPPRLLPGASLAGPTNPLNRASMNTYMSGAAT